jgi:hypothetical protein
MVTTIPPLLAGARRHGSSSEQRADGPFSSAVSVDPEWFWQNVKKGDYWRKR